MQAYRFAARKFPLCIRIDISLASTTPSTLSSFSCCCCYSQLSPAIALVDVDFSSFVALRSTHKHHPLHRHALVIAQTHTHTHTITRFCLHRQTRGKTENDENELCAFSLQTTKFKIEHEDENIQRCIICARCISFFCLSFIAAFDLFCVCRFFSASSLPLSFHHFSSSSFASSSTSFFVPHFLLQRFLLVFAIRFIVFRRLTAFTL